MIVTHSASAVTLVVWYHTAIAVDLMGDFVGMLCENSRVLGSSTQKLGLVEFTRRANSRKGVNTKILNVKYSFQSIWHYIERKVSKKCEKYLADINNVFTYSDKRYSLNKKSIHFLKI